MTEASERSSGELTHEVAQATSPAPEEAREQLAASVEELTDRIDPRPRIEGARPSVADNAAPIAAAVAVVLVLIIWRRRRR